MESGPSLNYTKLALFPNLHLSCFLRNILSLGYFLSFFKFPYVFYDHFPLTAVYTESKSLVRQGRSLSSPETLTKFLKVQKVFLF